MSETCDSCHQMAKTPTVAEPVRDCRMDEVDVALQWFRQRVRQGTDRLRARLSVPEDAEVGVEQVIRLADWNLNADPITGG